MGCSSCGGRSASAPKENFKVTYPDGSHKVVGSEHEARIEMVLKPGSTYAKM